MDGNWLGNSFLLGFSSLVNYGGLAQLLFNYLPTNNPPAGAGAQQKTVSGDQLPSILYNELVDADSLWPLYARLCWVSGELVFQVILPCLGC